MANARDEHVWTVHAAQQMEMASYIPEESWPRQPFFVLLLKEPWKNVLDFGCGTGLWRGYFKVVNPEATYVGLDQNPAMIAGARARWKDDDAQWVLCPNIVDGEKIPFDDGFFDIVFTSAVLQHNNDGPDKDAVLSEIRRVLRLGGRYICFENTYGTWNGQAPNDNDPSLTDGFSHTQAGWQQIFVTHRLQRISQYRDLHEFRAV